MRARAFACVRVCQGFHCKHNMMYTMLTCLPLSSLSLSLPSLASQHLCNQAWNLVDTLIVLFSITTFWLELHKKHNNLSKLCQLSNFRFELAVALSHFVSLSVFRWVEAGWRVAKKHQAASWLSSLVVLRDSFAHFVQHPRGKRLCPGDSRPGTLWTGLCGCLSTNAHWFNCCSVMSFDWYKEKHPVYISLSLSIVLSPSISRSEIKVQNIFQYVNKLCEKSKTKTKSRKNSINFGQNKKKKRSWAERAAAAECGQGNALNC